ncbi:MAG: serine hydrolase domain-containing protein [Lapillicoccus sp.]
MTRLNEILQRHVDSGTIPGAVALVDRAGAVEVETAGVMTLGEPAAMPRDAIMRLASITKPIVAAATMTFVEDGTFALDTPVRTWLPELASPSVVRTPESPVDDVVPLVRPITVRDLLTFVCGYGFAERFDLPAAQPYFSELAQGSAMTQDAPPPDEWMARLSRIPLLHQPGEAWLYNLGSDILGVLLVRAAGKGLQEVLADRVLGPVGMPDTGFEVPADHMARLPTLYRPTDDGLVVDDPPQGAWCRPVPFPSGAGGLAGTLDDWYAFARMLLAGGRVGDRRVLSAESVRMMTTDQTTPRQRRGTDLFLEGQGWGFGGSVDIARVDPWNVPGRYGWIGGSGTAAHVVPSSGLVTILLTQVEMTGPTAPEVMRDVWAYAA